MFTVALIGGDGAGKTSIAKSLEQSFRLPVKYLYMGLSSTQSSNFALPTSRLVLFFKRQAYRRMTKSGGAPSERIPASHLDYKEVKRGPIWLTARFLNRLAEAGYRQLVSLGYQMRGYVVIYDRHFLFDAAPEPVNSEAQKQQRLESFYYWILSHGYPKPDLAIFLDAPGEVLYERKREATPDYLNRQREAYLEQGKKMDNFVRVDATQPLDKVLEDVTQHIMEFYASKRRQKLDGDRRQTGHSSVIGVLCDKEEK